MLNHDTIFQFRYLPLYMCRIRIILKSNYFLIINKGTGLDKIDQLLFVEIIYKYTRIGTIDQKI